VEDQKDPEELCDGFLGAAVFDTSRNSIRGIVIYDNSCSASDEPRGYLHSVNDYRDWILQVSGADKASMTTIMMLLSFVIVNLIE
jgi:secreted trypsin-like serine protease